MRLIKRLRGGDLKLTSFNDDGLPTYAILSHTWIEGQEVTYKDLIDGTGGDKSGYNKIKFCSDQAAADGYDYIWIDTCCINKSDSQELSTAINSMFRCKDLPTKSLEAFRRSRWFTRGWTLQELLAPATVEFFCKQGRWLGNKTTLEQEIHEITRIPVGALQGLSLDKFTVEERIGWVAKRTTTLKEDKVYCLLGIFGVFLPLIYGEGEAYAEIRLREEIQRRQDGHGVENSRDLSIFSSLSFPRDENFVGRAPELWSLEQSLLQSHIHRRMAIYGLGGCGKSALAIEFAHRAMSTRGRLVFWVPAIGQESFVLAYLDIGIRLNIPGIEDNGADVKKLVRDYLTKELVGRWLIVIDNADDEDILLGTTNSGTKSFRLMDYLPRSNNGAILFTTRSRKVAVALTQESVIQLTDLDKLRAGQLLSHRLSNPALLDDETAIDKLLEVLTYLPLAIVQAAAFINNNSVSINDYISLFQEAGANEELFQESFVDPGRYEELDNTIARTWHISFDQIRKQDPLAAHYLSFMACINCINIPQSLVAGGSSLVQQTKALGTLTGYAFLTERQQSAQETAVGRSFDMHRLVHMASVLWLEKHKIHATWMRTAAAWLGKLLPYGGHRDMRVWMTYLPHAIHVAKSSSISGSAVGVSLLVRLGMCQASLGQYAAAETTHREVMMIEEMSGGSEHLDTLTSMQELGEALYSRGKYAEAEGLHRRTLAISKKVLGEESAGACRSVSNLAATLSMQGKHIEAEESHREALRLSKKVSGEDHSSTLKSMNNLAEVLASQGKYVEAEESHREILNIRKRMLGEEHPSTMNSMSNLAGALCKQGKYAEAKEIHCTTLKTRMRVLGDMHPDTLLSMHHIALVLCGQGQYDEAEKIGRKTLGMRTEVLGEKHPNTLLSMSNLAFVLTKQLRYDEARCIYEQAQSAYNTVLGEDHPWTRTCQQHYRDLIVLQEQDLTPMKKKAEVKAVEERYGGKNERAVAMPFMESTASHPPFVTVPRDGNSKHLSTAAKQPDWRDLAWLKRARSRGLQRASILLRGEKNLRESQR